MLNSGRLGGRWIGVRAAVVRGRLEVNVTGFLSLGTVGLVADEIATHRGTSRLPFLVDMSEIVVGGDFAMAMTVAMGAVLASAGDAPVALIGEHAERAAAYLRAMDSRVMWFGRADHARRWLRRQMVS